MTEAETKMVVGPHTYIETLMHGQPRLIEISLYFVYLSFHVESSLHVVFLYTNTRPSLRLQAYAFTYISQGTTSWLEEKIQQDQMIPGDVVILSSYLLNQFKHCIASAYDVTLCYINKVIILSLRISGIISWHQSLRFK